MRITESRLRRAIRSVIKENHGYQSHQSHKESIIEKYTKEENRYHWNTFMRSDFYVLARGESLANDIKSMYYPSWELNDFIEVIEAIDGSYNP